LQKKCTQVHTLVRIDNKPLADNPDEIRAFIVARNELLRLPRTLDHTRKIGVARFFVVDNGSTDASKEFLLAQADCHVFETHNSHLESGYGVEWQNALLNEYGMNHWCLVVDADEWFVYPGYETKSLSDFAAYLERTGAQGVFSFLLDMYGPGTIAESISAPERSLLDTCRYFDSQYRWNRRPRIPPHFPELEVFGGPRLRLFFPNIHRYYHLIRALWRTLDFGAPIPLPLALRPPPTLTKIPFVRWLPGTRYEHVHATTPIRLSDITGVLLHFKFLQDFYTRVSTELNRKDHRVRGVWAGELKRYLLKFRQNPSLSFYCPCSVGYENSEQLVRLGLLREDQGWRQIRASADCDPRATG
jgi:glycosyltransferase involved in cell wall biosynthesis